MCQICAKDREPAVRDHPTFLECEIPHGRVWLEPTLEARCV